ncbi:MAG: flagellar hook-associated family protein [Hyphomicrobiaceae bacterium]|nr:flagellar hook-associated family protein [Hyphomicrobiaceae bacterium]
MKAIFPSSVGQYETLRMTIQRKQSELTRAQIEVSSGRHADMGLALGTELSRVVDLRGLADELDAITASNGIAGTRLDMMQSSLSAAGELAQDFFASLTAARQSGGDRGLLVEDAKARLGALIGIMSASSNGAYLFSGTSMDTPPLLDYLADPPGPARQDVSAAFQSILPPSLDPADITAADMSSYLQSTFASLFDDAGWKARFSGADDGAWVNRISTSETITTSVSANTPAVRNLVQALVATIDTDISNLNADAFEAFMSHVSNLTATVSADMASASSQVGIAQERLAKASERITLQRSALERDVGSLEGVDPYEAATRLTSLMNALEATYQVTSRLQNFSLLNYL